MASIIQLKRGTAAAWTSANTVLSSGELGFETDTKKIKVGDGTTAWTSLAYIATDGDITAVVAGTGLSGGSTSGSATLAIDTSVVVDKTTAQTLTNKTLTSPVLTTPSISTMTTTGDILYASAANTPARLGIGSTGQSLIVAAGVPSWATSSSGSMTLLTSGNFTAVPSFTYSSVSQSYKSIRIHVNNYRFSNYDGLGIRLNGISGANKYVTSSNRMADATSTDTSIRESYIRITSQSINYNDGGNQAIIDIPNYTSAGKHIVNFRSAYMEGGGTQVIEQGSGSAYDSAVAVTSLTLIASAGYNFNTNATYEIYGVN